MNNVVLVGNLVRDPEVKGGDKPVCRFTVACSRSFKNAEGNYDSDFISCVAFGKTAEFVEKYFKKGQKIGVTGEIRTGSYTKDDGSKVYTTDVSVSNVEFVSKKSEGSGETAAAKVDSGFVNVPDGVEEALPF